MSNAKMRIVIDTDSKVPDIEIEYGENPDSRVQLSLDEAERYGTAVLDVVAAARSALRAMGHVTQPATAQEQATSIEARLRALGQQITQLQNNRPPKRLTAKAKAEQKKQSALAKRALTESRKRAERSAANIERAKKDFPEEFRALRSSVEYEEDLFKRDPLEDLVVKKEPSQGDPLEKLFVADETVTTSEQAEATRVETQTEEPLIETARIPPSETESEVTHGIE